MPTVYWGGNKQSSVRSISTADFNRILERGLPDDADVLPRIDEPQATGFEEQQVPFVFEQERDRVALLSSRAVRDRAFRRLVLNAYGEQCAVTGLRFINGGGRAEVDAAHIRPVERGGPDSVQNGIALSGTAHWMFDRGLISLSDDLEILVSRHVNDLERMRGFINRSGFAEVPSDARSRPHPRFLAWHRQECFKQ